MPHEIIRHRWSREWPRSLLGAIFMTAGIAKIPVMREFADALAEMSGIGLTLSLPVAAGVALAELAIGGMFLLGLCTVRAGFAALIMAVMFAGFQGARLLFGVETPCYCLGVVGVAFPSWAEMGLDLLIVVVSVVMIRRAARAGLTPGGGRLVHYAWLAAFIPLGFVSIPFALKNLPPVRGNHETVLQKVRAEQPLGTVHEKEIVLCLNLDEFHCSLCFDDLVALLDSLRTVLPGDASRSVGAALRSEESPDSTGWRLRRWARETGISGPVAVLQAAEFDEATGGKSTVWITRGLDRIVNSWALPLGEGGRREVLAILAEP